MASWHKKMHKSHKINLYEIIINLESVWAFSNYLIYGLIMSSTQYSLPTRTTAGHKTHQRNKFSQFMLVVVNRKQGNFLPVNHTLILFLHILNHQKALHVEEHTHIHLQYYRYVRALGWMKGKNMLNSWESIFLGSYPQGHSAINGEGRRRLQAEASACVCFCKEETQHYNNCLNILTSIPCYEGAGWSSMTKRYAVPAYSLHNKQDKREPAELRDMEQLITVNNCCCCARCSPSAEYQVLKRLFSYV